MTWTKEKQATYHKQYRATHEETLKAKSKAYRDAHKAEAAAASAAYQKRRSQQFTRLKISARERDLSVSLTFDEFVYLRNLPCEYCDSTLPDSGYCMDRKDNSEGYILDNVVPCCPSCNTIKGHSLSYDEMKALMFNRLSVEQRLLVCQLPR